MRKPIVDSGPWGKFIKFCENENTTVKIIEVQPGQSLPIKKHGCLDLMWMSLDQGLIALLGDETISMKDIAITNEPIWIPRNTTHSIKNSNVGFIARFLEITFNQEETE